MKLLTQNCNIPSSRYDAAVSVSACVSVCVMSNAVVDVIRFDSDLTCVKKPTDRSQLSVMHDVKIKKS